MKKRIVILGLILGLLMVVNFRPAIFAAKKAADTGRNSKAFLQMTDLFTSGIDDYILYRIPGVVVTADGSAIAYCEARKDRSSMAYMDIYMRRSTDGGNKWSKRTKLADGVSANCTMNNPVMIAEKTSGTVHFLYCKDYAQCFYRKSTDNGQTWSRPVEITATFDKFKPEYDWKVIATGPGHGIQLKNGRLLVPVWLSPSPSNHPAVCATIYSDDHGVTWNRGQIVPDCDKLGNPSESRVVQLEDGTVLLNIKNESLEKARTVTKSPDGATGWSTPSFDKNLVDPTCGAGMVEFNNEGTKGIIFANCDSDKKRENLTVRMSSDDGKTWAYSKLLQAGGAAYSDLAVGPDGMIYCLYERFEGKNTYKYLTMARFNAKWLTN